MATRRPSYESLGTLRSFSVCALCTRMLCMSFQVSSVYSVNVTVFLSAMSISSLLFLRDRYVLDGITFGAQIRIKRGCDGRYQCRNTIHVTSSVHVEQSLYPNFLRMSVHMQPTLIAASWSNLREHTSSSLRHVPTSGQYLLCKL